MTYEEYLSRDALALADAVRQGDVTATELLELALADPDGASRLAALLGDGLADQLAAALAPPASEAAAAPEVPVVDAETQTAGELVQHPSAQAHQPQSQLPSSHPQYHRRDLTPTIRVIQCKP